MDRERCSPAARHRTKRPAEPTLTAPSKTRRRLKRYENKRDVHMHIQSRWYRGE